MVYFYCVLFTLYDALPLARSVGVCGVPSNGIFQVTKLRYTCLPITTLTQSTRSHTDTFHFKLGKCRVCSKCSSGNGANIEHIIIWKIVFILHCHTHTHRQTHQVYVTRAHKGCARASVCLIQFSRRRRENW